MLRASPWLLRPLWPLLLLTALDAAAAVATRKTAVRAEESERFLSAMQRRAESTQFGHAMCLRRVAPLPKAEGYNSLCKSIEDLIGRKQESEGELRHLREENARLSALEKARAEAGRGAGHSPVADLVQEATSKAARAAAHAREDDHKIVEAEHELLQTKRDLGEAKRELGEVAHQRDLLLGEVKRLNALGDSLRQSAERAQAQGETDRAAMEHLKRSLLGQIEALQNENAALAADKPMGMLP